LQESEAAAAPNKKFHPKGEKIHEIVIIPFFALMPYTSQKTSNLNTASGKKISNTISSRLLATSLILILSPRALPSIGLNSVRNLQPTRCLISPGPFLSLSFPVNSLSPSGGCPGCEVWFARYRVYSVSMPPDLLRVLLWAPLMFKNEELSFGGDGVGSFDGDEGEAFLLLLVLCIPPNPWGLGCPLFSVLFADLTATAFKLLSSPSTYRLLMNDGSNSFSALGLNFISLEGGFRLL